MLKEQGLERKEALEKFREFCGDKDIVGHNINFDVRFLQSELLKNGLTFMSNKTTDTLLMARRSIDSDKGYGLKALAEYFKVEYTALHRALEDCLLTYEIYEKLKA